MTTKKARIAFLQDEDYVVVVVVVVVVHLRCLVFLTQTFHSGYYFPEVIDFYANTLEGTIPKELAKLPNLRKSIAFIPLFASGLIRELGFIVESRFIVSPQRF